jgi:hypothetical protein
MLILFRRLVTATPTSTLAPYVALNEYWDDEKRTIYRDQETSTLNDPSEVAVDAELARYAVRPGLARVVRYAGEGQIYTQDESVTGGPGGGGVCTLAAPAITPNPAATSNGLSGDASVSVVCSSGVQPYTLALRLQNEALVLATATSASTAQPAQFGSLNPGRYQVTVTDAVGCVRTGLFDVFGGAGSNGPYGPDLRVTYSYANGLYRTFWNPITKAVEVFFRATGPGDDPNSDYDNPTPLGQPIDGYMLPDGYTWAVVTSDGAGGVLFTYSDTRKPGLLELHNVIFFHPDRPQDATGGVLVECTATDYPLSFQLGDGTGTTYGPPNATGHFDGLTADTYAVTVTDSQGRTLSVPFSLRARYGKRWHLDADNIDSLTWTVEIWQMGYTGAVEAICGAGETPVRLKSDGLNSSIGGQGDLPPAIGTSCELNLLATVDQLADVQLGADRDFRVDAYRAGALEFRGYVSPDIYTADMQYGLVPVSLTATDGLAALKDTDFTGHVGQALTGRWPLLNTLLHCLSRCDVALPVRIATNRRPAELASTQAPEQFVLTERAGYAALDKAEPLDMRAVVEAVAQTLGGTLVQRAGQWEIRSGLEAAGIYTKARAYRAAGSPLNVQSIGAPTGLVRPPRPVRTAGAGWYWLDNSQRLSIRAGWKSLAAASDAAYATNALPAGDAFGNDTGWNQSLDALLPTVGWSENAAMPGFPLLLERAGEKNTDLGTRWPQANGPADARYLQSGLLPNAPENENIPWALKIVGRLVALDADGRVVVMPPTPGQSRTATVALEVVTDGQRPAVPILAAFDLPSSVTAGDTTLTFPLGPLPAQSRITRLRLSPWTGTTLSGVVLLIKQVSLVLQPQGVTWDGKDNFRADSNRGTVRPTDAVKVFHCDVPLKAGLFEANAYAFRRATTVAGGALTTIWARPTDLLAAPLLESAAFDGLALRAAPSRLLNGVVRYVNTAPPRMLDTVDAPDDLDGRRFLVASVSDDLRAGEVEVALVEIGRGTARTTPDPLAGFPAGVRLLDGVTFAPGAPVIPGAGTPRVRATHHGVRIAATG